MFPTATAIRACTNMRRTASCSSPGAGLAPILASSTSRTTSPAMPTAGCMWPTASHRVQVFDGKGKYETQWNNLHRPCGLFMPPGKCPVCYIGELGAVQPVSRNVPNLGPRVTIVDNMGKRISRLGGLGPGLGPTEFLAPHGLAVDTHGDLYVGEVSWTNWPQTFRDKPRPDKL